MAKKVTGERFGVVRERYCSNCGEELEWERQDHYCFDCRQEYNRQYREKYKEEIAEYQREWRENNKENRREYYKEWAEDNKEYRREYQKEWREARTQDQYIYLLLGSKEEIDLYAGSTKYRDRPTRHLKGQTHLQLDVQDWIELEVDKLRYINVTDYIDTSSPEQARAEREFLEGLLIQDLEPLLNNSLPVGRGISVERMDKLKEVYYNLLNDWIVVDIKKIVSPTTGKTTFNYKDLIFNDNEDSQS